jgi:AFG3 family protein
MKNLLKELVNNFIDSKNKCFRCFLFYLGSLEEDTTLPKGLQDWNRDRQKEQEKPKPSN